MEKLKGNLTCLLLQDFIESFLFAIIKRLIHALNSLLVVMIGFTIYLSGQEFDVSELEKLFALNAPKPTGRPGGNKPVAPKNDKITLVFFRTF
jgi:hypothetical protein